MPIKSLRAQIDTIDHEIIKAIRKRIDVVHKIGDYKKANKLKAMDEKRVQEVLSGRSDFAKSLNLNPKMIEKIFSLIIDNATELQRSKINNET